MLPSEDYIAQQITPIRVSLIHSMRQGLKRHLTHTCRERLLALYQELDAAIQGSGREYMGQRSLKNICLSYLMSLNSDEEIAIADR